MEPVQLVDWYPPSKCITPALRRWVIVPWLVLAFLFATIAYWVADRPEPILVVKQATIPKVRAGEAVYLKAEVIRDITSDCALTAVRTVVSDTGFRFPIDSYFYSFGLLRIIYADNPGVLRVSITVPPETPVGKARLITSLEYHCNPLDKLWPIIATTELHFEVVP